MTQALKQGTQEWLDSRVGMLTGSRIGSILDVNPYSKPSDVLREMVREFHGYEREFTGNIATQWGNDNEEVAIEQYEQATGQLVISTGFHRHKDIEWLGASPDGIVGDGLIEVKCPFSKKVKELKEQPHYAAQIQLQLEVTGKLWCDFVSWTPDIFVIERVSKDESWLSDNYVKLLEFREMYLSEIDNPVHLESLEVFRDDDQWIDAEADYLLAKAVLENAENGVKQCKAKLLELAGDKKTKGPNLMAYPIVRQGSVSYSKAIKDLLPGVDLDKYKGKPSTSWAIKTL